MISSSGRVSGESRCSDEWDRRWWSVSVVVRNGMFCGIGVRGWGAVVERGGVVVVVVVVRNCEVSVFGE